MGLLRRIFSARGPLRNPVRSEGKVEHSCSALAMGPHKPRGWGRMNLQP